MTREYSLTGVERFFEPEEIIVSKTDTKGKITYANKVFQRIAQYSEAELIGRAHSIVRHPDMPRCVFKFLWDRLQSKHEIFAYVVNRCKSGDHYWVFAHVTPTINAYNQISGYHSNRRVPSEEALGFIKPLYKELLTIEQRHRTPREQYEASLPVLVKKLESQNITYDELMFQLCA